jgi:hypothetical protein
MSMGLSRKEVDRFNLATQGIYSEMEDWEARVGSHDINVKQLRNAWESLRKLISQANIEIDRDGKTSVTVSQIQGPADRAEAALDDLAERYGS